jgi:hypothetical protein
MGTTNSTAITLDAVVTAHTGGSQVGSRKEEGSGI